MNEQTFVVIKGRLQKAIFVAHLNAIFVSPKFHEVSCDMGGGGGGGGGTKSP